MFVACFMLCRATLHAAQQARCNADPTYGRCYGDPTYEATIYSIDFTRSSQEQSYTDLPSYGVTSMILSRAELSRSRPWQSLASSSKTVGMGTSLTRGPCPTLGLLNRWHCWIHKEGTTIQWMDATRFDSSRDYAHYIFD